MSEDDGRIGRGPDFVRTPANGFGNRDSAIFNLPLTSTGAKTLCADPMATNNIVLAGKVGFHFRGTKTSSTTEQQGGYIVAAVG